MNRLSTTVTILETPEEVAERKRALATANKQQERDRQTLASVLTPRPGEHHSPGKEH